MIMVYSETIVKSSLQLLKVSKKRVSSRRAKMMVIRRFSSYFVIAAILVTLILNVVQAQAQVDPDLEVGFPVFTDHQAPLGSMTNFALLGDIDGDLKREVIFPGIGFYPKKIHAVKSNGSFVPGWPLLTTGGIPGCYGGVAFPALGQLTNSSRSLEVVWSSQNESFVAVDGGGNFIPGWPNCLNDGTSPPALADVDGDGLDEIFIGEEDQALHAYRSDGTDFPGWPVYTAAADPGRATPAIADLDQDGDLEIVTVSETLTVPQITGSQPPYQAQVFAFEHEGNLNPGGPLVPGFPVTLPNAPVLSFPAIGDVDGDSAPEIVVVGIARGFPWNAEVYVISNQGVIEAVLPAAGGVSGYYTAPALADLYGDGIPEIIVQTDFGINVFGYSPSTGTYLEPSGWPILWQWQGGVHHCLPFALGYFVGKSSPVVGDADGDQEPDIVVTTSCASSNSPGEVRMYDRFGNLHPNFPKVLNHLGLGGVPAISDIDLDGRNEIVVLGLYHYNLQPPGMFPHVWVYDLGGGPSGQIEWGQFMAGPKHQSRYTPPLVNNPPQLSLTYDIGAQKLHAAVYDPDGLQDLAVGSFSLTLLGNPTNYLLTFLEAATLTQITPVAAWLELYLPISAATITLQGADQASHSTASTVTIP